MSLTKARELRQERAKLYDQAQADVAANPEGFTPEVQERWDARMAEMDRLKGQIDTLESRHAQLSAVREDLEERQERMDDMREFGAKRESAEDGAQQYRKAFHSYLQGNMDLRELRALAAQTKGTAAFGGNTVPTDMEATVVTGMLAFGGMRQAARIVRTDDGRNLDIPRSDDTGNVAAIIGEATAISNSTHVPFGKVTLEAVKYATGPIKISRELVQDSVIDVEEYVRERMIERFARGQNTHFTTRSSTETNGPHGITNDSTGALTVANGSLTPENLMSLVHKVDLAYRPRGQWMFDDQTALTIRQLRWATSGQFVWEASLKPGQPDMLLGYPVVINNDVPLFGTSGNKPIWFGDWRNYWIREVRGLDLLRLEERYAEEDVIALVGYQRVDGRSVFGSTVPAQKPYRCIIQAT